MASEQSIWHDGVVSRDPLTGREVYSGPAADANAVAACVGRAVPAAAAWAGTNVATRSTVLRRFADGVEAALPELTEMLVREVGKRREDAQNEVLWTALSARWYADHPPVDEVVDGALVCRVPLGAVAVITPWNVPLVTPAWKWLPALQAGNAVLWKPSELATGVAVRAVKLFDSAGLPADTMQLVPGGAETAAALCADPRVAGVHFTGSTRAGRAINALVAPRFARVALEMGGLNHAVVFADADLDEAAEAIVGSATALAGQKCTSIRRVLVHDSVADALISRLADRVEMLTTGDPGEPSTLLGPLISAAAGHRARAVVASAEHRGRKVIARSPSPPAALDGPSFFPVTLIDEVPDDDPLAQEELFAPVVTLAKFADSGEVWDRVNASGYGLSASIHTHDPALVAAARGRLRVGVLGFNRRSDAVELAAPFGGRGLSGNGASEGGGYAYDAVTDRVAVYGDAAGRLAAHAAAGAQP